MTTMQLYDGTKILLNPKLPHFFYRTESTNAVKLPSVRFSLHHDQNHEVHNYFCLLDAVFFK